MDTHFKGEDHSGGQMSTLQARQNYSQMTVPGHTWMSAIDLPESRRKRVTGVHQEYPSIYEKGRHLEPLRIQ